AVQRVDPSRARACAPAEQRDGDFHVERAAGKFRRRVADGEMAARAADGREHDFSDAVAGAAGEGDDAGACDAVWRGAGRFGGRGDGDFLRVLAEDVWAAASGKDPGDGAGDDGAGVGGGSLFAGDWGAKERRVWAVAFGDGGGGGVI